MLPRIPPIGFLAPFAVAVIAGSGAPAWSDDASADPAAVANALVEHYVLPGHRALAEATAAFETAAADFCRSPGESGLAATQSAFHAAADAWLAVEPLHFGPMELLMRSPRMYFWPDPTGRVAQDVAEFVAEGDATVLAENRFQAAPVSLQGLPAAEVLMFDEASRASLLAGDEAGEIRCALLQAIAANVRKIGAGLLADWQSGEQPFTAVIAAPGPENPYFASQEDVTVAFLKAVNHALRLALDTRLKPVLGPDMASARSERAEARRSGRSMRNIVAGIEAAQAIYLGAGGKGLDSLAAARGTDAKIAPLLRKAFSMTLETATGIDAPLPRAALDPALRPKLKELATQLQALRQLVGTRLAAALGLSVGFNALDGD